MATADNTIETTDDSTAVDQESLPSTTSVLDRSKSLFGNSSAVLSTPDRQPTPEQVEENDAVEEVAEALVETRVDQEDEDVKPEEEEEEDEEPANDREGEEEEKEEDGDKEETAEDPEEKEIAGDAEENGEDVAGDPEEVEEEEVAEDPEQEEEEEEDVAKDDEVEEEVFEKKTVSMDTGGDEEPMDVDSNEKVEEEEEKEEEEEEEETPKKKAKRAAPTSEDEETEEQAEKSEDVEEEQEEEEEAPIEETPTRSTRGRNSTSSATKRRVSEVKQDEEETPKRGSRARRSAVQQEVPEETSSRPRRSVRGRKSNVEPEPEPEEEDEHEEEGEDVEEEEEEEEKPKRSRKSKTGDVGEEEEVSTSSRRSTRAKPPPKSAPVTPAVKKTPSRGRKKNTSVTEDPIEEEEVETPKRTKTTAKSAPTSSKKKSESFDPYDLDTEMEHHPEPLKNIHMEVQNFGAVKYAKVGGSESKYAMTERAAESRISSLSASPATKNRRSLADMTPGKEKVKHKTPVASTSRKPRAKKSEEAEDGDVEMESPPESSSATPSSSNRGRKRKSEAVEASVPKSAKKQAIVLRELSEEEQLRVDHPYGDDESHAPGARVYALFQKAFYPAIIMNERDGLGRYKLQFTADKVVKDVPNAGIIPLRAIAAGKTAIFEEEDVRIDSGPNDISASNWAKGEVVITLLDENDEPTGETKTVIWNEVSFDQSEWRDYIKNKEQNATAIVVSNITTITESTRIRKSTSLVQKPSKQKSRPKKAGDLASSRGASTPRTLDDEDDDKVLPMKEEAIGKNIFAGKVFMLTSANRTIAPVVPSVFKKKNMIDFITQNGGVVVENLEEFQDRHTSEESILISDTYYRTHKYLAALARGVPCVSNLWLQECGVQGEMVDLEPFILPAGASIFDDVDKPAPRDPSKLLAGKTMYVHSVHKTREMTQNGPGGTFIEIWNPILELLGADTVSGDWRKLPESQLQFDIVLVDGTFQKEVMEYADSIGAQKVTSEWVIQTIILNGPPEPSSHSKFDPYRLHQRSPA